MSSLSMIPEFKRLDGSNDIVHFRAPTVADCRNFASIPESSEQLVVTQYLSDLQVPDKRRNKDISDPKEWTDCDRMLALFWIYIATQSSTVITQSYFCQHCDQEHGRQMELSSLSEQIKLADAPMEQAIQTPNIKQGFIVPLRGFAMEHIEDLKNFRDSHMQDSKEWAIAHTDMRLYESAYRLRFDDDDKEKTEQEQAKVRFEYLLTLEPDVQYQPLAIEIRQAMIDMHHGLPTTFIEGELNLITPEHKCPNKEGSSSNLLLPFHHNKYFPAI